MVHGDIKPSNILIMRDGHGKLCDFGLSTWTSIGGPSPCLQEEMYTPMFRSPELLEQTPPCIVALSDDIWALGISIYTTFITTAIRHTSQETTAMHVSIIRDSYEERRALYQNRLYGVQHSALIAEVLAKCLDTDPTKRTTAAALYALLSAVPETLPMIEYLADSPMPAKRPMDPYTWYVQDLKTSRVIVAQSAFVSADAIAMNLWLMVHIEATEDLLKSSRELFQLLKNMPWSSNKCAALAAVLVGCMVRRSARFKSIWCSKMAGCSITDFDFCLLQAISFAILNNDWSRHILKI
jgi:serine/threonine protein kinase